MATRVRHHYVVLKKSDGGVEQYQLKPWIREHPDELPDMDTNNTSHELRRGLTRKGWVLSILPDRVLVIKPDDHGEVSYAENLTEVENGKENETEISEQEIEAAADITFGLERDLQSALRANIEQLEAGLSITDGGKERVTEAGRLDITAADSKGNVVIVELKAGTAQPDSVTQILAYMGAIAEADRKPVRGILVAGDFHKRVIMAARAVPNLELRMYSYRFAFETIR